jgi:hypothetical protein
LLAAAIILWPAAAALSQDKAAKPEKEKGPPPPEELALHTSDGVQLAMTYFPGTQGKQSIPVVLLHMWKQNRSDFKDLAPYLQKQGCAVLAPDLRGHGDSTHRKGARAEEVLKADKMSPPQLNLMVSEDMMAVKAFLWEKNNAGELNIDKLCIVGAELGAVVAIDFAAADAEQQAVNRVFGADGEYKVGRFVKALVLLSPERSCHGLSVQVAARNPVVQRDIAMLILVGKQENKSMEAAKQIHGLFKGFHPEPTGENKNDRKTLFLGPLDTSLQGTNLLDPKFGVAEIIGDFIERRLVKSKESEEWKWAERKRPHQ